VPYISLACPPERLATVSTYETITSSPKAERLSRAYVSRRACLFFARWRCERHMAKILGSPGGPPIPERCPVRVPLAPKGASLKALFVPCRCSFRSLANARLRRFTAHLTMKLSGRTYGGLLHHTVRLDPLSGPTWNPPAAILSAARRGVLGSHDPTSWLWASTMTFHPGCSPSYTITD